MPTLLALVAVVVNWRLSKPICEGKTASGKPVNVAVKSGRFSPYFLALLAALMVMVVICGVKKYSVSELPPSRLLGVMEFVKT